MLINRLILNIFRQHTCLSAKKYYKFYSTDLNYQFNLKIKNVSITDYVNSIRKEYNEFYEGKTEINSAQLIEFKPVIQLLNERENLVKNIHEANELLEDKDEELRKLASEEKSQYEQCIREIDEKILANLLPTGKEDEINSVVLEVNAGVGGQEAMLFAKELFDMYSNYCAFKGWEQDIAEYTTTDIGGIRRAVALINGTESFRHLKHEAGVHRVQRIPQTEKSGRIHTSTVSVFCLPQPTEIDIKVDPKDLKIETKRSSGAGGQHVNTTDSCVRITHLPTNITVECQVDRSQIKNRKMALARLNAMLYQKELELQMEGVQATRKGQVRSNFRNEKIRTYNFCQDRITDHRLTQNGTLHNLEGFLDGGQSLDNLINYLDYDYKLNELLKIVNSINKVK